MKCTSSYEVNGVQYIELLSLKKYITKVEIKWFVSGVLCDYIDRMHTVMALYGESPDELQEILRIDEATVFNTFAERLRFTLDQVNDDTTVTKGISFKKIKLVAEIYSTARLEAKMYRTDVKVLSALTGTSTKVIKKQIQKFIKACIDDDGTVIETAIVEAWKTLINTINPNA